MDLGLGPDERLGVDVVSLDEGIDVLSKLFDRGEGCTVQRLCLQDREPDFHLIEPRSPRRRERQRSLLGLWVLRLSSTTWMAVSGQAATMSFMKSRNSTRRRRFL